MTVEPEYGMYNIGSYMTMLDGNVVCLMSERFNETSDGDAVIRGLSEAIQFIIEEVEAREEELKVIIDDNEVVEWIKGKEGTDWSRRFIRNKARNLVRLFDIIKLECRVKDKFDARNDWGQISSSNNKRWIVWK
ncbi:hypothetical protein PIB30_070657 [Stylosanthes scabra]|uniref:RNase H type-1 domain-containing protein n=1 Tax=Stylosanthes scabra TaxID=79078 RepID=A0ABU6RNH6_9FABA|nr:hypothetical protein [Stylosanthes scabra]